MKPGEFPDRAKVCDSWWPWRVGIVVKQNKSSVYVEWLDGGKDRYDKPHSKFLRLVPPPKLPRSRKRTKP